MDALVRFYEWERAYLVKAEYDLRSAFAMFEITGFQGGYHFRGNDVSSQQPRLCVSNFTAV
jgi:hypothetical protein